MKLEKFSTTNLFGYLNIKIPVFDNKLILVAENGAGKTTVLRLMYLFLSKQWSKLNEYEFDKISAVINGRTYDFSKSDYHENYMSKKAIEVAISQFPIYEDFIINKLSKHKVQHLLRDDFLINELETQNDVPISMIYSILEGLSKIEFDSERFDWKVNMLYLPTYRRIERNFSDLYADMDKRLAHYIKQLFPQLQKQIEDEKSSSELRYSETEGDLSNLFEKLWRARDYERWNTDLTYPFIMELIEFGMEDVQFRFSAALKFAKENNSIVEKYLEVINKYLGNHKEMFLTKSRCYFEIRSKKNGNVLPFSVLSSGEKQILSLFSYFLSSPGKTFIIIDEPELSLSLTWQESLIKDILSFDIKGLVVATHSPFIVTNSLKSITHGLNEYTH